MSRIGNNPINIPEKVKLNMNANHLDIQGPKGKMQITIPNGLEYKLDNNIVTLSRENDEKKLKSLHGLTRALIVNAVEGVSNGIKKTLKIEGVGFKVEMKGKNLMLSLGFSHPIVVIPPEGVDIVAPNPTTIEINGFDKQLVGETAAVIRKLRKPEPYKGKGIRYEGEFVRRKAGKTAAK